MALDQDILGRFVRETRRKGVVGEDHLVATVYLAITSRVLDRPVSLVVKGASSSGKSFSTETTCKFFPSKALVPFTGLSEKALVLSERNYEHRTIVVYEAAALRERAERQSGDQTAYFLRSLVSEGEAHYEMSVRTKDGSWTTRRFNKRGPTNVIVTTTAVSLHNENETRMLSIPTNDTPAQTRSVLLALADETERSVDLEPWHELQEWIWRQDNRVVVPFARYLAEHIPPVAVRLRRDFGSVLSLVKAHAVLHQATRDRDERGRIIATERDYEAVRGLVLEVVSDGVGATVPFTIRETVEAIKEEGTDDWGSEVVELSAAEIGRRLKLDKSAARRRLHAAMSAGYVVNREERRGRPGRYAVGDPLPDDREILPSLPPRHQAPHEPAGQAAGGTVAGDTEGVEREAIQAWERAGLQDVPGIQSAAYTEPERKDVRARYAALSRVYGDRHAP